MKSIAVCVLAVSFFSTCLVEGAWEVKDRRLVKTDGGWSVVDGQPVRKSNFAAYSAHEHHRLGKEALDHKNWKEALHHFEVLALNYPETSYGQDANFFKGVAQYHLAELDFANDSLSQYLKNQTNPRFFQEVMEYKFLVAEKFKNGAKRHMFGKSSMPKWSSGWSLALEILDEVIVCLPADELAAKALYSKAWMLHKMKNWQQSVETYQMVIRRFPKNPLAPKSYLAINRVFLDQSVKEFQNPDILTFAEINLNRFEQDFPGDERLELAKREFMAIKEVYAKGLFETAQFYERTKKMHAAKIYYQKAIADFPETKVSKKCQKRLSSLRA